jgi:hypothetical protein
MTMRNHRSHDMLGVEEAEPLSELITIQDGHEIVTAVDNRIESDEAAQNALNVFGAWSDLDWDEAARSLDRIRHESAPTPPIDE